MVKIFKICTCRKSQLFKNFRSWQKSHNLLEFANALACHTILNLICAEYLFILSYSQPIFCFGFLNHRNWYELPISITLGLSTQKELTGLHLKNLKYFTLTRKVSNSYFKMVLLTNIYLIYQNNFYSASRTLLTLSWRRP